MTKPQYIDFVAKILTNDRGIPNLVDLLLSNNIKITNNEAFSCKVKTLLENLYDSDEISIKTP